MPALTVMPELIEGLPDAVSIRCLARVPFQLYPKLELVCHSWRDAFHSAELYTAREEVNAVEELLCVCAFEPDNLWQLYDPRQDLWITLPVLPSIIRQLAHFGVVYTAGKLFVLGGGSAAVDPSTGDPNGNFATDEVWSYDLISRQWSLRAPMIVPRSMFACCILDGKVIVAGGFTNCRKSISQAEVYDPEKDTWVSISDLHYTHNSASSGVVIEGKVHVLHKGLSSVQVLDDIKQGWSVHDYGWLQGPMAVVRGELYVMTHGLIYKQKINSSKEVVPAPDFGKIIGCAITGLGDDIYVIGGVGPEILNWDIKALSDVDVLTPGSERPVWRKVSPMTKCRGSILGCTQLRI
ncbi:non-motor actin binding protein [Lithospermum erythrorhizon]|uniref:Non-motor actin binding protein n=1 Tax=Lithospermum erythrorhizon TaxID=34254 RepID=A0AAV3RMF4_LITER